MLTSAGAEGAEVIYALRNSEELARTILNNLAEKGQIMRKYYQRRLPSDPSKDYYYMLRNTPNAETVIVEYGFLDNKNDANKLKNNYKDYADAVVEAVLEYKNIPYEIEDYYIVKKGDTLWNIAKKNNITVNELKELNNLTNNTLSIGQKLKLKKDIDEEIEEIIEDEILLPVDTYTVKAGDTLYSIAKKYNMSVNELKEINNIKNNILSIGQVLKLDKNANGNTEYINNFDTYTVKGGDTLYSISNKYDISVDDLKKINNLPSNLLSIGQVLLVPYINEKIYIVKKGDTLWNIAKDNNTTVDNLKLINNLVDNTLTIGQQLLLN